MNFKVKRIKKITINKTKQITKGTHEFGRRPHRGDIRRCVEGYG